jgi:hypothetical protein
MFTSSELNTFDSRIPALFTIIAVFGIHNAREPFFTSLGKILLHIIGLLIWFLNIVSYVNYVGFLHYLSYFEELSFFAQFRAFGYFSDGPAPLGSLLHLSRLGMFAVLPSFKSAIAFVGIKEQFTVFGKKFDISLLEHFSVFSHIATINYVLHISQ